MKKTFLILLALITIGIAGCSSKPKENTVTPTPTATPTESVKPTEKPMEGPKDTATPAPTEEAKVDLEIGDTFIQGTFIENTTNSPTTITFMKDGNFTSNVNACTGMVFVEGTYTKDGDTIAISIPAETGVYYIDHDQPFYFTLNGDSIKDKYDGGLSCADVGEYTPE
ncbi:hypothetical protein [Anaerorhabdus sp.]|uniref:hypothetical protein n=1 Tax=Anaerorhabdus sp. TaxID=1872524 RepID=UPI002FCB5DA2